MTEEELDVFCRDLRQGDILNKDFLLVGGSRVDAPLGVVFVSQTCDLVRSYGRPNALVALVVELDASAARDADRGRTPRWIPISGADGKYADLEYLESLPKRDLTTYTRTPSMPDYRWEDQRRFALRVGRFFSRLALPDEVVPWFDQLRELVMSKANKLGSPLGRALEAIAELRVEAPQWLPPGIDLTVHVILRSGELDDLGDDPSSVEVPEALTLMEVSALLFPENDPRPSGAERDALWRAFGRALASVIGPRGEATEEVATAVLDVTVEVVTVEDFNLLQYRRSDELDLAHLSPPLPESRHDTTS